MRKYINEKFQKELSQLLNDKINQANIGKKNLAELLEISAVYVTKLTTHPGKLPSPKRLRDIIEKLSHLKNGNFETETEVIINKYAGNDYKTEYYVSKLEKNFKNNDLFIDFLKQKIKVN